MVRRIRAPKLQCVIVDLNTQVDFLDPHGAYPVANLETLVPTLRRLIAWTKRNYAPVVSSVDSHRDHELRDGSEPLHCLDGSIGQHKIDFTIFPQHERVEFDNTLCVPLDLFQDYQQIIFRKREGDLLTTPKADRFLTQLTTDEFVVFGIDLECSIKMLALGLLSRKKRVTVIEDGCGYWSKAAADLALRQLAAKGAKVITTDELLTRRLSRRRRYLTHAPDSVSQGTRHRINIRVLGAKQNRKTQ